MYWLVRPIAFRLDPELAHRAALRWHRLMRPLRRSAPRRPVTLMGIDFPNRVGLAAGYDKDAIAWRGLGALGFGHVEVGTVTPLPQPGNPRPRLFRVPEHRALINRLGFPSEGMEVVVPRLGGERNIVLGVSIGPNRFDDPGRAAEDYEQLVSRFVPTADYLAINVSSPNTPGLRAFQTPAQLRGLLQRIVAEVGRGARGAGRIVVKLSPDVPAAELVATVEAVEDGGADGVIATNTTTSRPGMESSELGGLSGAPLGSIALRSLAQIRELTSLPLFASGGIMNPQDARRRLDAGADLVQLYTGFVYTGPRLVREIAAL